MLSGNLIGGSSSFSSDPFLSGFRIWPVPGKVNIHRQLSFVTARMDLRAKLNTTDGILTALLIWALILSYRIEVVVVADTNQSVHAYLESLLADGNFFLLILSPALHMSEMHLLRNLTTLILFGLFLEQRSNGFEFFGFFATAGLFGNFIAPLALQLAGVSVAFGIGASAVTHALYTRELVYRADRLRTAEEYYAHFGVFLVSGVIAALAFLSVLNGDPGGGVSVTAHAAGLLVGVIFALEEILRGE
jgi:membrane associated rhomboid family serine protease